MSNSLFAAAASQLETAGFFVEHQKRVGPKTRREGIEVVADLLAWAGGEDGELIPEVVVEVKEKGSRNSDAVLAQLSRVAAVVGAPRAFLFDGRWQEADPTFTRFDDASCPRPSISASESAVPNRLLAREIWSIAATERDRGRDVTGIGWLRSVVRAAQDGTGSLSHMCRGRRGRIALARILSEAVSDLAVPIRLLDAMVRMLDLSGPAVVLDPACRLGGALWSTAMACSGATLKGWWSHEDGVNLMRDLAAFCDLHAEFACAPFEDLLAKNAAVDAIVSVPPFNVRLRERVVLAEGSATVEFDVALLDHVVGWLKPGGRAVVVVAPRFLFSESAAHVRERLTHDLRVVAVVELPVGVFTAAKIGSAIIVLEKASPRETLVARLGADWEAQLASTGDFFRAYQLHLNGETL